MDSSDAALIRRLSIAFSVLLLGVFTYATWTAMGFPWLARIMPLCIGLAGILVTIAEIAREAFFASNTGDTTREQRVVDMPGDLGLPLRAVAAKGALHFAWIVGFLASIYLVGFHVASIVYVAAFMRFQAKAPSKGIIVAVLLTLALIWGAEHLLNVRWPPTIWS